MPDSVRNRPIIGIPGARRDSPCATDRRPFPAGAGTDICRCHGRAHPQHPPLPPEVARRRTFAIISHPDAGKTTLTEKFLLYGGAIQLAGQVRAKGEARRHARRTS